MGTTHVADYIGKPDNGYVLVALLSEDSQSVVSSLLKSLKGEIGEGLWAMPDEALHITLCEIIQPKPYTQDKQTLYEANEEVYKNAPAQILKNVKPVKVHFNKIVVSPQAITIQGEDDGSFNKIRQQLVEKMPLPNETKLPPDIVHSSIARFTQELDLENIKKTVASHSIDFVENVQEFRLIHNVTLPLLRHETICVYPLIK